MENFDEASSADLHGPLCPCRPDLGGDDAQSNLLPNGSFELWVHHGIERLRDIVRNDGAFEGDDPLIPTHWTWQISKPMKLKQSTDAHSGKFALAVSSATGRGGFLQLGRFEAMPARSIPTASGPRAPDR